MKKNILLFSLCLYLLSSDAQNCLNTSVGLPPLNDLGSGYWQGFQGGLYSNGSNYRPAAHNLAGLNIAQSITPLDTNGNVDLVNGKIVWLSIGMSNTTQETQVFIPMADTFSQKNPKLVLIDGAQGGQDIDVIIDPNANYWNVINQRLANAGLSRRQVQVIWFKQAQAGPDDTAFASYPDTLKNKFKVALQNVKDKYPRTRLAYLSSRIYAGYATTGLNPEPYAWYSGWSVKRLIEDQINGDTSLTYIGGNARVPWLAWGPYLWADGTTPRSDGLTWNCPTDYSSDGTHPATSGRRKVANMLFDFFISDSTSTPWFLNNISTGVINDDYNSQLNFFPNPVHTTATLQLPLPIVNCKLSIYNVLGEEVKVYKITSQSTIVSRDGLRDGIYFYRLSDGEIQWSGKLILN